MPILTVLPAHIWWPQSQVVEQGYGTSLKQSSFFGGTDQVRIQLNQMSPEEESNVLFR
jgi:hypothetical protein